MKHEKDFNAADFSEYKVISPDLANLYSHFKIETPLSKYNFLVNWVIPYLDTSDEEYIRTQEPQDQLISMEKIAADYNQETDGATFNFELLDFYKKYEAEVNVSSPKPDGIVTRIALLIPRIYFPSLMDGRSQFVKKCVHNVIYKQNIRKYGNLHKLIGLEKTVMGLYKNKLLNFEKPDEKFVQSYGAFNQDMANHQKKIRTFIY